MATSIAESVRAASDLSQTQTPLPCALVIEDDDHIGQLLQFMLERENYRVHLARDGRAGKAFIESQPPPAIALLDVMLPFFDGFQLVGLVRAQPGWESVPVIMLTAKTQERDIVTQARRDCWGRHCAVPRMSRPRHTNARQPLRRSGRSPCTL